MRSELFSKWGTRLIHILDEAGQLAKLHDGDAERRPDLPAVLEILRSLPGGGIWRRHPLGFASLQVGGLTDGSVMRVHAWIPGFRIPQRPPWTVHDHIFDLSSRVVVGAVVNVAYGPLLPESGGPRRVYEVSYDDSGSRLVRTEVVGRTGIGRSNRVVAGEWYYVPAGEFHETRVPREAAVVTLARTSPPRRELPRVLGTRSGRSEYAYERSAWPPDAIYGALTRVADASAT
jgi:hypothetical protein